MMDKNVKDALCQPDIFRDIFVKIEDLLAISSIDATWNAIACRNNVKMQLYLFKSEAYLLSPDDIFKRNNVIANPKELYQESQAKNEKYNQMGQNENFTQELILKFDRETFCVTDESIKANIMLLQYYLDHHKTLRILDLTFRNTEEVNVQICCKTLYGLKSETIRCIKGIEILDLAKYCAQCTDEPKKMIQGFPNATFFQINCNSLLDSTSFDEYDDDVLSKIVTVFEDQSDLSIRLLFGFSQETSVYKSKKFGMLLSSFRRGHHTVMFPEFEVDKKDLGNICSIYIGNAFHRTYNDNCTIFRLFSPQSSKMFNNLKEFSFIMASTELLSHQKSNFMKNVRMLKNLKIARIRFVLDTTLEDDKKTEMYDNVRQFIFLLPSSVGVLHMTNFPIFINDNFALHDKFPNLIELKYSDIWTVNYVSEFPADYFVAFEKLEILLISCIQRHMLNFNSNLKVVAVLSCYRSYPQLLRSHKNKFERIERLKAENLIDSTLHSSNELQMQTLEEYVEERYCICHDLTTKCFRNHFIIERFKNDWMSLNVYSKTPPDFAKLWNSYLTETKIDHRFVFV